MIPKSSLRLLLLCAFALALCAGSGVRRSAAQTATPFQGPRAVGLDAQVEQDTSGAQTVFGFLKLPADRSRLRGFCDAKRQAIKDALAAAEESLARATAARDWVEVERQQRSAGLVRMYEGDMPKAITHLEAALKTADEHQGEEPALKELALADLRLLGVAQLRRGEVENCALNHNAEMCILPLSVNAQHTRPSGSEAAAVYFKQYLQRSPESLEIRWLLNVAYMTLGKYPASVPRELLIPPAAFESKESFGRFVDVATSAGLDYFGNAGGTVADDFDDDGLADVVVTSVSPCESMRFYRNNGDGTFADRTAQAGLSEQLGGINLTQTDYNNDGRLDLFIMRGGWEFPMRNSLLRNNGDGSFTDVTVQAGLYDPEGQTHSAAWGDYDNDGRLDLFVAHETTPSRLYRNRGDGTFEDVTDRARVGLSAYSKGAVWGDYDGDGYPDIYVSNYQDQNFLFHNNRDGTFDEVAVELGVANPRLSFPAWFFDYDNDGRLDLFVASYSPSIKDVVRGYLGLKPQGETIRLYRNDGRGGFEDVTKKVGLDRYVPAMGANFGDLDNDGYLDFYLGTGTPSYSALVPNVMFRNHAGQYFADVTTSTGTGHLQKGHGVAFTDLNNDGTQDVFANLGGAVFGDAYGDALFRNPGGHGNHFLSVRLVGSKSNRAGIGAKIKLTVAGEDGRESLRFREVTSGGSFGSSSLTQSIGLGTARRVKTLEVWWPASNTRQIFRDVPADQFVEVREAEDRLRTRRLRTFTLGAATPAQPMPHHH
jgi:hypothetical protein